MALFARKSSLDALATHTKMGVVSLSWFRIVEEGVVKRDFIAWKKPDGAGCLIDQADGGRLYENQNANYPFTCGADAEFELAAPYMTFSDGSAIQTISDGMPATVDNMTITQDAVSHRVAVNYTLGTTPSGARAIVTAQVRVSGEPVNGQHLLGDVNLELEAGPHTFYWFPDIDVPGTDLKNVTVDIEVWKTNVPPAYIAFDMRWQGGELNHPPYFFNSTNELAGTINSDVWRTDYLLMRRINANGALFRRGESTAGKGYENRYVTFTNDYYIGVFELTQGQFGNCVTNLTNPSRNHVRVGETWRACPLDYISVPDFRIGGIGAENVWPYSGREVGGKDVSKPLAMIRKCTGAMLDMPTEAQWEFACRAGTGTKFYNGTDSFADSGSRNKNNPSGNTTTTWTNTKLPDAAIEEGGTARVGSFAPNPWGLYDMYGNVWEMCLDQYVDGETFEQNTVDTPFIEPEGSRTYTQASQVQYVRRGGGWGADTTMSGSHYRMGGKDANSGNGYRLVCPVPYGKSW